MTISDEAVEAAARAMAILKDEDGCFLEVDAWNALEEWEREAHPENYPGADIEDCTYWLEKARAALEATAPFIRAEALEELADEMEWVKPESACEDAEACCGSAASCDRMRPSSFVVGTSWLRVRAAEMRQGRDAES